MCIVEFTLVINRASAQFVTRNSHEIMFHMNVHRSRIHTATNNSPILISSKWAA